MTLRAPIPIDHLVYAASDLERGMKEIEALTGISPTPGGQHPGRGTRNALIALGDDVYLEIVAPDPRQATAPIRRWLGVDAVATSRLTTWAAKAAGLYDLRKHALEHDVPVGEVHAAARERSDGTKLAWRLTEPEPLVASGVVPFFIDWGESPHPARSAAHGASLVDFRMEHPAVAEVQRMLHVLGLDVAVTWGERPSLVAVIEGPHGRVELR
jgi:hypothetical protein